MKIMPIKRIWLYAGLWLFALTPLLTFSGCRCSPLEGGRRPQVLPDPPCSIIDYDFDCETWSSEICEEEHRPPPLNPKDYTYRLAIGDIVAIALLGEEDLSADGVVVAPDGNIYYAFLDAVPALGLTIDDLTLEIQKRLEKYFRHPLVSITPKFNSTESFKVLGRVRRPGVYPLNSELGLREAIGVAGDIMTESYKDKDSDSDLQPLADFCRSYLLRDGQKVPVDFERLLYDPSYHSDIIVQSGDFIYIAPEENHSVYILGAVRAPGRVIWRRDQTLMEVLGAAAGWGYGSPLGANLHSVLLIRGPLEAPCAMCIDVTRILNGSARDLYLQPEDIIYVHNKTLRFGRYLVRVAVDSFLQSFGIAAGSHYGLAHWFLQPGGSVEDAQVEEVP